MLPHAVSNNSSFSPFLSLSAFLRPTYSFFEERIGAKQETRKRCNSDDQFISAEYESDFVGDLSQFDWIADAESFICMTEK